MTWRAGQGDGRHGLSHIRRQIQQAFDRYIKDKGYTGIRALVAFSGTVENPDQPGSAFTEVGMNNRLAERELSERFAGDDYRVLIVAEKYQTGFDQPLLHTMYAVKKVAGVSGSADALSTQSHGPRQARTFVLDFRNEENEIFKAFNLITRRLPSVKTPTRRSLTSCTRFLFV